MNEEYDDKCKEPGCDGVGDVVDIWDHLDPVEASKGVCGGVTLRCKKCKTERFEGGKDEATKRYMAQLRLKPPFNVKGNANG